MWHTCNQERRKGASDEKERRVETESMQPFSTQLIDN